MLKNIIISSTYNTVLVIALKRNIKMQKRILVAPSFAGMFNFEFLTKSQFFK